MRSICIARVMLCLVEKKGEKVKSPRCKRNIQRLNKRVLKETLFGFAQVDVKVPEELHEKFSETSPLFVVDGISEVPEYMREYQKETGREEDKNSRKLLGVMKAKRILLYTPLNGI